MRDLHGRRIRHVQAEADIAEWEREREERRRTGELTAYVMRGGQRQCATFA